MLCMTNQLIEDFAHGSSSVQCFLGYVPSSPHHPLPTLSHTTLTRFHYSITSPQTHCSRSLLSVHGCSNDHPHIHRWRQNQLPLGSVRSRMPSWWCSNPWILHWIHSATWSKGTGMSLFLCIPSSYLCSPPHLLFSLSPQSLEYKLKLRFIAVLLGPPCLLDRISCSYDRQWGHAEPLHERPMQWQERWTQLPRCPRVPHHSLCSLRHPRGPLGAHPHRWSLLLVENLSSHAKGGCCTRGSSRHSCWLINHVNREMDTNLKM